MEKNGFFLRAFYCGLVLLLTCTCGGCGLVSIFASQPEEEKKIPAEVKLADFKGRKLLVLVNQPAWIAAPANLQQILTKNIQKELIRDAKFPSSDLISWQQFFQLSSDRSDFYKLTAEQVAKEFGADLLLFVALDGYNLKKIEETDYWNGSLSCQTYLLDCSTGEILWPKLTQSKSLIVGFDIDTRQAELVYLRLTLALSHCITRYFYDCPKNQFKIAEDKSEPAWQEWDK